MNLFGFFLPYWIPAIIIVLAALVRRKHLYEDICISLWFPVLPFLILVPQVLAARFLVPLTWDARLRQWDLALGLDGFAVARFSLRHPLVWQILSVTYLSLPVAIGLNWVVERSKPFMRAALLGALIVPFLFVFIPACGPRYAFGGYPWHAEARTGLILISHAYPRNCFPSMHLTWALLIWLNARSKIWKTISFVYVLLTVFATVAIGEHYFVDLIAAVPFALAVQYVASHLGQVKSAIVPVPRTVTRHATLSPHADDL